MKNPVRAWAAIRAVSLVALGLLAGSCQAQTKSEDDYTRERRQMVTRQIEARGISDTGVLEAMRTVPRHLFVPEPQRAAAYQDYPLPIGEGPVSYTHLTLPTN